MSTTQPNNLAKQALKIIGQLVRNREEAGRALAISYAYRTTPHRAAAARNNKLFAVSRVDGVATTVAMPSDNGISNGDGNKLGIRTRLVKPVRRINGNFSTRGPDASLHSTAQGGVHFGRKTASPTPNPRQHRKELRHSSPPG